MYNKVTSWHFIIKKVFAPFLFSCKQNIDYEEKMHLLIHKTRDLKFYGTTASKNVLWCKNKCEHKFPLGKFISCRFFPVANNILHKNTEKSVVLSIRFCIQYIMIVWNCNFSDWNTGNWNSNWPKTSRFDVSW